MRWIIIMLMGFAGFEGSGQSFREPVSGAYNYPGGFSVNSADAFSPVTNIASLAEIKNAAVGVFGERRFLLDALNVFTAIADIPTARGNIAFQADYSGFKNYNQSQLGFGYARTLGIKADIGLKFNYFSFRIPGYGSSSAMNFEIACIAHLSEKVHTGISVCNPVGGELGKTGDKLPSEYTFGIGYEPSTALLISAAIIKEEDMPVDVQAGVQYNFEKKFFARAGLNTTISNGYAGAGIAWNMFRIDFTVSYHPQLGFSPGMIIILNVNKKAK